MRTVALSREAISRWRRHSSYQNGNIRSKGIAMSKSACVPSRRIATLLTLVTGFALPFAAAAETRVSQSYGKLPLHFEANQGQTHQDVRFLARGAGYSLYLTPTEAALTLTKQVSPARKPAAGGKSEPRGPATGTALRMSFAGANPRPRLTGLEELPGKANYFIGNDPAKWRTNVPTYAKVRYTDLYPRIELLYYGNQRQLEYDLVVRPGADPTRIVLDIQGADRLQVDAQGDLVLQTTVGPIRQRKPVIYQEIDGVRKDIPGGYVLKGEHQVGYKVAAYDASQPLVIDPVLSYSTYLGSSDEEGETRIAVDAAGNAYVAGETVSSNFPTTAGAFQTTFGGGVFGAGDVFVTKLNPTGSALVYSTYLGGSSSDAGYGIAVDAAGNAYVTGGTGSTDFPTTIGAFQTTKGGGFRDAFVTKLNPTGSALVYSTYLGGSGVNNGFGIAVDALGNAYVTGQTFSTDFPTTPGAIQTTFGGGGGFFRGGDAFVTKLNPTGSALVYSTYLGGLGSDTGFAIALEYPNAYVTGHTLSRNFPTTTGAFQTMHGGGFQDAFVTKIADIMSPPAPTPGTVSLGGFIDLAVTGGKATFGGNVQFQNGDPSPTGNVRYLDHVTGDDIKATSFTTLVIGAGPCGPDTHALIFGKATVNGVPGQDLQVNVDDCSAPGSPQPSTPGMLMIVTGPNQVYVNRGPLAGGDIQVEKAQ